MFTVRVHVECARIYTEGTLGVYTDSILERKTCAQVGCEQIGGVDVDDW